MAEKEPGHNGQWSVLGFEMFHREIKAVISMGRPRKTAKPANLSPRMGSSASRSHRLSAIGSDVVKDGAKRICHDYLPYFLIKNNQRTKQFGQSPNHVTYLHSASTINFSKLRK